MKWGSTYRGPVPIRRLAAHIEECAEAAGMSSSVESWEHDLIVIRNVQQAPWYTVVIKALPQTIRWTLRQSGAMAYATSETMMCRWLRALIIASCATMALLYNWGFDFIPAEFPELPLHGIALRAVALLASLVLVFVNVHLLGCVGGRKVDSFWEAVKASVEASGTVLEPLGRGISRRYFAWLFGYLLFVFTVMFSPIVLDLIASGLATPTPMWLRAMLLCLCLAILALLIAAWLMWGREGVSRRVLPMLSGALTLLSVALFLGAQIPWIVMAKDEETVRSGVSQASVFLATTEMHTAETPEERAELLEQRHRILQAMRLLAFWGWVSLAGTLFILAGSTTVLCDAVRVASIVRSPVDRLRRFRSEPWVRRSVSGAGFLFMFRIAFAGFWFTVSLVTAFLFCSLCSSALRAALGPSFAADPIRTNRAVDISIVMSSVSLGRDIHDPVIDTIVRLVWIGSFLIILSAACWSVCNLIRSRRNTYRRLRATLTSNPGLNWQVCDTLRALSKVASLEAPTLVISENNIPSAWAYRFGWIRVKTYVEISSRCLVLFTPAQQKALLAHELSHILRGDCLVDNLLRFLGRVTFVGDSFVRCLENSFGYETEADRVAVVRLGADPVSLKRCLWKLRNVAAAEGAEVSSTLSETFRISELWGSGAQVSRQTRRPGSKWKRLRLMWCEYLQQYTGQTNVAYWHPATEERVTALSAMASSLKD